MKPKHEQRLRKISALLKANRSGLPGFAVHVATGSWLWNRQRFETWKGLEQAAASAGVRGPILVIDKCRGGE